MYCERNPAQAAMRAAGTQTHHQHKGMHILLHHMVREERSRAITTCFRMNPRHKTAGDNRDV